jgi:hypothetical protein
MHLLWQEILKTIPSNLKGQKHTILLEDNLIVETTVNLEAADIVPWNYLK